MSGHPRLLADPRDQELLDVDGYALFPFFPRDTVETLLRLFSRIEPTLVDDPCWPGERRRSAVGSNIEVGGRPDGLDDLCYVADQDLRIAVHKKLRDLTRPWLDARLVDYECVGATFMNKGPSGRSIVALHQGWNWVDETDGQYSAQLWCPLVHTEQVNGGLGVIPKTHLLEWPYRAARDDGPFYEHFPMLVRDYYRAYSVRAGEALMFHGRLVHGSPRNWLPAHRPIVVLVVVPKSATMVHYLRIDSNRVRAYGMSPESSDDLVAGEPPPGHETLGVIEHHQVPPTADEVRALVEGPIANPDKGNLPDQRTIDDLIEAAGNVPSSEAHTDLTARGQRSDTESGDEVRVDFDRFVSLYFSRFELPLPLGERWALTVVRPSPHADRVHLELKRDDGASAAAWLERRLEGRHAFGQTRFLSLAYYPLPEQIDPREVASELSVLLERIEVAEADIDKDEATAVFQYTVAAGAAAEQPHPSQRTAEP